ncbi:MAG TPA: hypothetical protein VFE51_28540 [Verrucomicrobiae bacterium]|nr:hypothetical protein [Verrucomicrobiae bacterium]
MISSLFSNLVWRAQARQTRLEKSEIGCGVAFTQGGGLSGLALGYYLAAPPGAPEATGKTGDAEDLVVVFTMRLHLTAARAFRSGQFDYRVSAPPASRAAVGEARRSITHA